VKPAESAPAEIAHDDEVKRLPGDEDRRHEVPAKPEPEIVTDVPNGPEVGVNVIVRAADALNDMEAASPDVPVTVSVYAPLAPDVTLNDPDMTPPDTVQTGFVTKPAGDDVIVQPESVKAKFDPEATTLVPAPPELGVNVSPGTTVKLADPTSP
jgi:hypothetical protein